MGVQLTKKSLYFICPTDGLETVINNTSGNSNYYYTSLGNSVLFDGDTVGELTSLIFKHHIREIIFVLSASNPIIKDALENRHFSSLRGLSTFYGQIERQMQYSKTLGKNNSRFIILSYHLNKKISELKTILEKSNIGHIKIRGKIYNKQRNTFDEIYSDLVCSEFFSLN